MIVSGSGQIDIANANVGATLIVISAAPEVACIPGRVSPNCKHSTNLKERCGTRNRRTGNAVECWSGRRTG